MRNIIIAIVILLILGGITFWYVSKETAEPVVTETPNTEETPGVVVSPTGNVNPLGSPESAPLSSAIPDPGVTLYTVSSQNFNFTPGAITVNKGEKVRIVLKNLEGSHDLVIDEYKVRTKVIKGAGEDYVEFVADKIGTFEYYCSVGSHREMGMKGSLIVK